MRIISIDNRGLDILFISGILARFGDWHDRETGLKERGKFAEEGTQKSETGHLDCDSDWMYTGTRRMQS